MHNWQCAGQCVMLLYVDYNDNYEDVDDDLKKDDGQIEKSCRHQH